MYQIPPGAEDKEKIIGGVLTLVQFLWLIGGLGTGLVLFVVSWLTFGSLALGLLFFIAGIGLSAPFAFYKKKDLSFFQYLKYKRKLNKQNVSLPNKKREMK